MKMHPDPRVRRLVLVVMAVGFVNAMVGAFVVGGLPLVNIIGVLGAVTLWYLHTQHRRAL